MFAHPELFPGIITFLEGKKSRYTSDELSIVQDPSGYLYDNYPPGCILNKRVLLIFQYLYGFSLFSQNFRGVAFVQSSYSLKRFITRNARKVPTCWLFLSLQHSPKSYRCRCNPFSNDRPYPVL